jgi:hypothetical protein
MKSVQLMSGEEWIEPLNRGKVCVRIQCCDCGLNHDIEFEVKDDKLKMRWHENRKATSAARRKHLT